MTSKIHPPKGNTVSTTPSPQLTRRSALTAAVLDADDAWRLGFAQVRGGLDDALALADRAVPLAPLSQAGSKIGMNSSPAPDEAYSAAFSRAWASSDLAEGQRAFGERRSPRFVGR